jgi:hypothetical protein
MNDLMPVEPALALSPSLRQTIVVIWQELASQNRALAEETGSPHFLTLADDCDRHLAASGFGGAVGIAAMLDEVSP